ncbi:MULTISPECIES: hypothetical protein [Haloarcula]|uniref:hypothetical protein n=1 Tax=Haloarcula TaxID=2237 RepID=UPI0023ECC8DE|nr:hypothetical protein [Halomicroarcula sp. XH51]
MGQLDPVAFDIETSGLTEDAVITVTGFAHDLGEWLVVNTNGRNADQKNLVRDLDVHSDGAVQLSLANSEKELLEDVASFVDERLNGDRHYVTAFNGETWRGGFDLPFCRTRYHRHDLDWPFGDIAYADMMQIVDRFDTGDNSDLVGVYNSLIGNETCDPFDDSAMAVDAFDNGDWGPLLAHNLADIQRTRELALLAGRFVARSDFRMKNLEPPRR